VIVRVRNRRVTLRSKGADDLQIFQNGHKEELDIPFLVVISARNPQKRRPLPPSDIAKLGRGR
jgi:hypothetical protein